jgi:hypothetical protein
VADLICNIAKGRIAHYASLPAANDALIIIPVEASGVEADDTLRDKDDVAAFFSGATNEQTTMGRKTVTASITITVDDTNNWVDIDMPDPVWAGAAGNAISDLLIGYDSDTTGGTDSGIVPLSLHDFAITPDGSDVTGTVASAGFQRAA